ncbi:TetR/AcrR family transcriptional regulator [Mycobacterium hackensackense]|uniref:TetR/AcrR family transcriptional regulator n=1 Tax=Mycobacterium hackensackense TaxID=228909 RepID=UPI002265BE74|nr:TetR/AcrR family transcriptional regulator [Mycobacterium hackensackense]MCV7252877.1 TetR/AcrR family transcriptional regulator [Mycobacterium hackensackense]
MADRRRRFIDAGLELLGGGTEELTVRAICRQSGVATRHFYEAFADKDEFVAAVFDSVVAVIAATTQAAVASVPFAEQNRAGITNLVRTVSEDTRVGRLLFDPRLSNAVLMRKRTELGGVFAALAGQHLQTALQRDETPRINAVAHFVVGGVSQAINAWLTGSIAFGREELVDQLTTLLDGFVDPRLY